MAAASGAASKTVARLLSETVKSRSAVCGSNDAAPPKAVRKLSSAARTGPTSRSAYDVGSMSSGVRTNRSSRKVARSQASAWLIAGCVMLSLPAAHARHTRPRRRLANGFCVVAVVLTAPDERLHVLATYETRVGPKEHADVVVDNEDVDAPGVA